MNKPSKEHLSKYILYGVLAAGLLGCAAFVLRPQQTGSLTAVIQVGDQVIQRIDLGDAQQEESFSILDQTGLPITFEIRDHAIRFLDSDCPDKVCVKSGFLKNDMDIASCLPNQTILTVELSR